MPGFRLNLLQVCLITAIVLYALALPGSFTYKLDELGFGVCHQISTHSYFLGGHQLPLCARCSGMYLGALVSLTLLVVLKGRSSRLPVPGMIAIFGVFFGAMVLDGVNSTLESLGAGLWDSTNFLRLLTGSLAGTAVAFMFYPMLNLTLWSERVRRNRSVLDSPRLLVASMLVVGGLASLVLSGGDWLFYPLSLLSIAGMLALLTMANTMLVVTLGRKEGSYSTTWAALTPILIGAVLCLVELSLLVWGRSSLAPFLTPGAGMPLVPGLP